MMRFLLAIGWNESMTVETVTDISLVTVLKSILINTLFYFFNIFSQKILFFQNSQFKWKSCVVVFFYFWNSKRSLEILFSLCSVYSKRKFRPPHHLLWKERNPSWNEKIGEPRTHSIAAKSMSQSSTSNEKIAISRWWNVNGLQKKTSAHLNYTRDRGMVFNIDTQMMLIFYLNAD